MALQVAQVSGWPAERIKAIIPSLWACAERFAETIPDETTAEYLIGQFLTGQLQVWIGFDEADPDTVRIALFAELRHYYATGVPFIEITGLGGERIHEALPAFDDIERWGARNGATKSRVVGRPAWQRLLRDRGYHQRAVVIDKPLDNRKHIGTEG